MGSDSQRDLGFERVKVQVLPDGRVTRKDGGKILGRTAKTMAEWTGKGWGPRPIKVGNRIFHDVTECLEMARGEKPIVPIIE